MEKKFLVLTLIWYWVEATPVNQAFADFDNTDISDLKYDSKDLENYLKYLDDQKGKTSGEAKKKKASKGAKVDYNFEDLKKFFKSLGLKDDGTYDDSETYGVAEGAAAKAVGISGKENRKYKKGTKTRGFHRVHHKDEYKKDKEFYEGDEISGSINKVGAKGFGYDIAAGSEFDKGQFHHKRNKSLKGKKEYSDKGNAEKNFSGYADEEKLDAYFNSDDE